ncbi:DUF799 domain-containing protein [Lonepinella sp. MS14437]|uniref:DUF799 domain-containing protein n=1 Tax=unclassified Lonepinella TaxID=2642006 RepID=UPI0036DC28F6
MKKLITIIFVTIALLLSGCAVKPKKTYDYSALNESKPKSILVVMPTNNSPEAKADTSVLSTVTYPLAELGYYVYPVALVDETFKQNGITDGYAIQQTNIKKIQEIFGADSILYINIKEYGTSYKVFDSVTTVELEGKLVDLRTGKVLWEGEGKHSQGSTNSNDGVLVALVKAAVSQIADTSRDYGFNVSQVAMGQLVYVGSSGGLLIGPRHPNYNK